jgi:hypothetical protein
MPDHELQRFMVELLRPLVERWLQGLGREAHTGADQFFYFREGDPTARRAPDVYVIDGIPQDRPEVGVWKTWEGFRPAFALELCGDRWQKDYDEAPNDYDAMGADEVVIFDPGATARSRRRERWQVLRRGPLGLRKVTSEKGDRVFVRALGCFLRLIDQAGHPRLRLATGDRGDDLFPTDAERLALAEAALAAEKGARVVVEAARAAELAARMAAEAAAATATAEATRLRAELERLRRG